MADKDILKSLVPLKHKLLSTSKFQQHSDQILSLLSEIPNLENVKVDNELILYVCNIIEQLVSKKDNIDKKALALSAIQRAIPSLSPDEVNIISEAVEFLCSAKLIIKKSSIKSVALSASSFILKRL